MSCGGWLRVHRLLAVDLMATFCPSAAQFPKIIAPAPLILAPTMTPIMFIGSPIVFCAHASFTGRSFYVHPKSPQHRQIQHRTRAGIAVSSTPNGMRRRLPGSCYYCAPAPSSRLRAPTTPSEPDEAALAESGHIIGPRNTATSDPRNTWQGLDRVGEPSNSDTRWFATLYQRAAMRATISLHWGVSLANLSRNCLLVDRRGRASWKLRC